MGPNFSTPPNQLPTHVPTIQQNLPQQQIQPTSNTAAPIGHPNAYHQGQAVQPHPTSISNPHMNVIYSMQTPQMSIPISMANPSPYGHMPQDNIGQPQQQFPMSSGVQPHSTISNIHNTSMQPGNVLVGVQQGHFPAPSQLQSQTPAVHSIQAYHAFSLMPTRQNQQIQSGHPTQQMQSGHPIQQMQHQIAALPQHSSTSGHGSVLPQAPAQAHAFDPKSVIASQQSMSSNWAQHASMASMSSVSAANTMVATSKPPINMPSVHPQNNMRNTPPSDEKAANFQHLYSNNSLNAIPPQQPAMPQFFNTSVENQQKLERNHYAPSLPTSSPRPAATVLPIVQPSPAHSNPSVSVKNPENNTSCLCITNVSVMLVNIHN
uniref:Uncharacterized protein n=1 Tax=Acrobeloides nanus TaxID=290746 RepID=A0A914D7V9_9BILA